MKTSFFSLLIILTASFSVYAQSDSAADNKTQFKLSINYNSGLNYYGRTDSLQSRGIFPMAELWITPKFYINAAPVFIHNTMSSLDYAGTVTTVGYQFSTSKWLGNIYALKPFYKQNSELVQSALKAQSGMSLTFLNKIVNLTAGTDIKLSDKTDYGASGGLDHIIRIQAGEKSVLVIDPSVYTYAGTQQFTNTYYQKKTKNFLLHHTTQMQQITEKVNRFNILAYELSMPVIVAHSNWQLILTPAYILPQNLIAGAEQGRNMFYTTAAVKYTF